MVEKLILDLSNASYVWSSDVPSAELEAVGKAHRALERVRRTSIKLFEDANLDVALRDALKRLQSSIVDLMANTLSHVRSSIICDTRPNPLVQDVTLDSYTQILDSLFVLARTTLDIRNAHTHGDAHDYLQRAATILDIASPSSSSTTIDRPNLLRCISGAFHNLAGTLYNAERYGAAIRFLTRACELGTRALTWRREQVPQSREKKEVDSSWRQLEEQLYRRWELLGVCHCKIGDHLVRSYILVYRQAFTGDPRPDTEPSLRPSDRSHSPRRTWARSPTSSLLRLSSGLRVVSGSWPCWSIAQHTWVPANSSFKRRKSRFSMHSTAMNTRILVSRVLC